MSGLNLTNTIYELWVKMHREQHRVVFLPVLEQLKETIRYNTYYIFNRRITEVNPIAHRPPHWRFLYDPEDDKIGIYAVYRHRFIQLSGCSGTASQYGIVTWVYNHVIPTPVLFLPQHIHHLQLLNIKSQYLAHAFFSASSITRDTLVSNAFKYWSVLVLKHTCMFMEIDLMARSERRAARIPMVLKHLADCPHCPRPIRNLYD